MYADAICALVVMMDGEVDESAVVVISIDRDVIRHNNAALVLLDSTAMSLNDGSGRQVYGRLISLRDLCLCFWRRRRMLFCLFA
jgi:hypothetical protein